MTTKRPQKFTYHFEEKNYRECQIHLVKHFSMKNPHDYSAALYAENYYNRHVGNKKSYKGLDSKFDNPLMMCSNKNI